MPILKELEQRRIHYTRVRRKRFRRGKGGGEGDVNLVVVTLVEVVPILSRVSLVLVELWLYGGAIGRGTGRT